MTEGRALQVEEVFLLSGPPKHTFVEPAEYTKLLVALRTPGRSVVVEGPSGIGKTTSITRAIEEAGLASKVVSLSARKMADIALIRELPTQVPFGTVIIDDFHRLDDVSKGALADLMKTLADEAAPHSKLVVIGIPNAGNSLISFGKDLANRIEVIPFEANPENKVIELLEKGEASLNIKLNIREEIARAAQGSFYVAQMLAHETCMRSKILQTQEHLVETRESYETVKAHVMNTLNRSFHQTALGFARGTKLHPEGRAPYLHLLIWLSESEKCSIVVPREADRRHSQKSSVLQVLSKGYLAALIDGSDDLQRVFYLDRSSNTLVVQDPQFVFYIRNLSWPKLAEELGYVSMELRARYDFALSFAGPDRKIAEAIFRYLQEKDMEVFYDQNEQHRIVAENVEEYLAPIYSSDAQMVVCILGPDYPKRVWTNFEARQFRPRFKSREVVPIVIKSTGIGMFDFTSEIGYIEWNDGEDFNRQVERAGDVLIQKHAELRKRRAIEATQQRQAGTGVPVPSAETGLRGIEDRN